MLINVRYTYVCRKKTNIWTEWVIHSIRFTQPYRFVWFL